LRRTNTINTTRIIIMKSSTATAEKFTDFLETASSQEIQAAFDQLGLRETTIRERLRTIEADWPSMLRSNTPEQQVAVRAEADALNLELQQLAARIGPMLDQKEVALRREAPALATALLKSLPPKLKAAEEARAAWLAAKDALTHHAGQLAQQRSLAREISLPTKKLDESDFERLTVVLDWLPPGEQLSPSNLNHRVLMSRLARSRTAYLDEPLDVAMARAWHAAGAGVSKLFGIYPEETSGPQSRPSRSSGYLDEPREPDLA